MALNINGTTGISGVDGSASSPALQGTDSNTGINFASDTVNINTGGVTRATVDSSGNLNIPNDSGKIQLGTSSDLKIYHDGSHSYIEDSGTGNLRILTSNTFTVNNAANSENMILATDGGSVDLYHNGTKKCSTTSDGIEVHGTTDSARIEFNDAYSNSRIRYFGLNRFGIDAHDGLEIRDPSDSFATRLMIDNIGRLLHGCTSATGGTSEGNITVEFTGNSRNGIKLRDTNNTGTVNHVVLVSGSTDIGQIVGTTSSVSYNSASDYRLKENVVAISDGISRLKTLKPSRFNFIIDPDKTVDGFLAHEVTAVPEAVTGTKDAVDSNGKPIHQSMDSAKLVPLLTAALQEAVAKIEVLETKVAALEAA